MKKFNERVMGMENESTKVTVGLGYTLNLGNFQSLRIDISVSDNKREGENTNDAFERVYAFVEKKLTDKVAEAQSEADGK
jgi:methyl coenzyme M reductase subunit D